MILSYEIENFYSFKEGGEIILEGKDGVSPVICLMGANASGKSNLLKGLKFLVSFCANSFNYKPDDKIPFETFFNNNRPTNINLRFISNDTEYTYKLNLTSSEVLSEMLYKKDKRTTLLFKREGQKITESVKAYKELGIIKIRKNASIVSTAHQYAIEAIKPIYEYFDNLHSLNLQIHDIVTKAEASEQIASKLIYEDKALLEFTKRILRASDTGILDLNIQKEEVSKSEYLYTSIFTHEAAAHKKVTLLFNQQSNGTKKLYNQLLLFYIALKEGITLILDELDTALHPDIIIELVNLFKDKAINKNGSQLLFSTHNIEVMNKLTKYQIILTGKEESESYSYKLSEVPGIRKDRNILSFYKSNKIGGKPRLKSFG